MLSPRLQEQIREGEELKELEHRYGKDSGIVITRRAAYLFKYAADNRRALRHLEHKQHKRYRATVVVIRDGKVLLVRDKGRHDFSLPGGGFKKGESTIQAGIREVGEELGGLEVISTERLRHCDLEGRRANHKVCQLIVSGEPHIRQHHELDKVVWWDMKSNLPVQGHVRYILGKMGML